MYSEETDICMLTKTWKKDHTTLDKLEQMGHTFLPVNRLDRPRGGIGLLFNSYLDITELNKGHYN